MDNFHLRPPSPPKPMLFEHQIIVVCALTNIDSGGEGVGLCLMRESSCSPYLFVAVKNSQPFLSMIVGTARNTQTDFLVLIEDSIKTLNVSNGPVKYQDAIEATKVRLNLAVARGVLLLPSRMIINTESIVGYNNNLRRATDDMKLGVNNQVNQGTKKTSLKLMAGGLSKINPLKQPPLKPNS